MRVLIISDRYFPDNSGTSMRSIAFGEGLTKKKVDVHIATLNKLMIVGACEEKTNVEYEVINNVKVHRYASQLKMMAGLHKLCKLIQFDVIHARGPRYGFISYTLNLLFDIPFITELNYILPQKNLIKKYLLIQVLRSSNRLIVLSNFAREWAVNKLGISSEKVDVIVNRIDTSQFNSIQSIDRKKLLGIEDKCVVGYVGTFHEWQGVIDFVKVAKNIRDKREDVFFLMVGYGPDYQKTKNLVGEYGLSKCFIFTGNVPPQDVPSFISAMDIVLLARTADLLNQIAIPLKLFEVMAMGKAIVVTPVKSLIEVIRNQQNGIIAGPDIEDISDKILELIDDENLRKSIGYKARAEVLSLKNWNSAIDELMQCYGLVIQRE